MSDANPITIPLLNPNEPEAQIVSVEVLAGQKISKGDLLCTLETTKSTAELIAEFDGYVVGIAFEAGQSASAGEVFCYIASTKDWQPPAPKPTKDNASDLPEGLRISKPALELARQHKVTLAELPQGPIVTVKMLQSFIDKGSQAVANLSAAVEPFQANTILVYGGSGHGKSVIELIEAMDEYVVHGVIDDGMQLGQQVLKSSIIGGSDALEKLSSQEIRLAANAVGGIGDIMSRVRVFSKLAEHGFYCPTLIHPSAVIEKSAEISSGAQIFPLAYIGSQAKIGFGCIINTGAIVSHDCVIADYANIAPGAKLAGSVEVGESTLIGMGVTVNLNCKIGSRARIGNSAVIKADVPDGAIVRAGAIWPH